MLYIAMSEDREVLGASFDNTDIIEKISKSYQIDYPNEVIQVRGNEYGFFDIYRNGNLYDSFSIEEANFV